MKAFRGFCIGLVVATVAVMVWTDGRLAKYEQAAKDAATARAIWQARYAEASTQVQVDTVRVTRWATRYDTVRTRVETVIADDTVTTVPAAWVRQLITVSDSTVSACRALVVSTRGALTACDSAQSALRAERDAWKNVAEARKPSKWQRALPWIAGAAGFYVGAKLRVP